MDAMWSLPQLLGYCLGALGHEAVLLGVGHSSGCKDKKSVVTDEQKGPNTKEPGAPGSKFRPCL